MQINTNGISKFLNMMPIGVVFLDTSGESNVGGFDMTGFKHTDETKQLMSTQRVGRPAHANQKAAVSAALSGIKRDDSFKDKARTRQTGVRRSDETKKKMAAAKKGRKMSDMQRAAIQAAWNKRRGVV